MVDIIIGATAPAKVRENPSRIVPLKEKVVDAQVLDIRPARKRRRYGSEETDERRRPANINSDPSGSTVLVLMIKDPTGLPVDLKTGDYKISLRISLKKPERKIRPKGITA